MRKNGGGRSWSLILMPIIWILHVHQSMMRGNAAILSVVLQGVDLIQIIALIAMEVDFVR
jgi:hypothetical protein